MKHLAAWYLSPTCYPLRPALEHSGVGDEVLPQVAVGCQRLGIPRGDTETELGVQDIY